LVPAFATAELCDHSKKFCGYWPGSSSPSTGAPTRGGKIKINPAAVPVEKSTGIETIMFDGFDFALVKGFGRVGAGISMSNSEDTFFGAPSIELPEDYKTRQEKKKKYDSQKYALAGATRLYSNKKTDMKQFDLNLGLLGKYNQETKNITGGAGLSGKLGPFTYGYAVYRDETQLNYSRYGLDLKPVTKFFVESMSIGLFLRSAAIDYAILRMVTNDEWTVKVLTGSLLLKRTILTLAFRTEKSQRPNYDPTFKQLEIKEEKKNTFLGVQFNIGKHFLGGVFYNYYTLRELSLGLTVFF
jgi:hypothetical protein